MDKGKLKVYKKCAEKQMDLLRSAYIFKDMKESYINTFRKLFCVQDPETCFIVGIIPLMSYITEFYNNILEKQQKIHKLNENFGFDDDVMAVYLNDILEIIKKNENSKNMELFEKHFGTDAIVSYAETKEYLHTTKFHSYYNCLKSIIEHVQKNIERDTFLLQIRNLIIEARKIDFTKFRRIERMKEIEETFEEPFQRENEDDLARRRELDSINELIDLM
jgi:hypothetical protein